MGSSEDSRQVMTAPGSNCNPVQGLSHWLLLRQTQRAPDTSMRAEAGHRWVFRGWMSG